MRYNVWWKVWKNLQAVYTRVLMFEIKRRCVKLSILSIIMKVQKCADEVHGQASNCCPKI